MVLFGQPFRCLFTAPLPVHRANEVLNTATAGAVGFPRAVKEMLHGALAPGDRWDAGPITRQGPRVALVPSSEVLEASSHGTGGAFWRGGCAVV